MHQVEVQGAVRDPGTLPRFDGMTLRDLIVRAGGLTPTADLTVEVSRLSDPDQRAAGQIAQIIVAAATRRAEGRKDGNALSPLPGVRGGAGPPRLEEKLEPRTAETATQSASQS